MAVAHATSTAGDGDGDSAKGGSRATGKV